MSEKMVQVKALCKIDTGDRQYEAGEVLQVSEESANQLSVARAAKFVDSRRQKDASKKAEKVEKGKRPRIDEEKHLKASE